jgi:sterol desaturase/sphingolipid hydroxylase (fatty acid hydroxylase superfamily)
MYYIHIMYVGHHDYHHKYSNYSKNAKNYAEFFLVWDQIFGTMTNVSRLQKSE